MIDFMDFQKDGFTDWAAVKVARMAVGENCRDCGTSMPEWSTRKEQTPQTCGECVALATSLADVEHSSKVRCPACIHIADALEEGLCKGDGGLASLTCPSCGKGFEIEVWRRYTFVSPALKDKSNGVT